MSCLKKVKEGKFSKLKTVYPFSISKQPGFSNKKVKKFINMFQYIKTACIKIEKAT